jgi:carbamoyltransferase
MYILGINYTLHDSSACLLKDEEIVFASEEERISRVKHDSRFPVNSIKMALKIANITMKDVAYAGFSWQYPRVSTLIKEYIPFLKGRYKISKFRILAPIIWFIKNRREKGGMKMIKREFGCLPKNVRFYNHHYSHAVSACVFSGMDEASVLVVDGRGAFNSTTIWHWKEGKIKLLKSYRVPNSIGFLYARFTQYLGFQPFEDEWKVMGLAPYGKPGVDLSPFIRIEEDGYWVNSAALLGKHYEDLSEIEKLYGPKREPEEEITQRHKDIAYALQEVTERVMLFLVKQAVSLTGSKNLCLAGGVALNCKANGLILRSGLIENIFVQPASGDDGSALGAAFACLGEIKGKLPLFKMEHPYFGMEFGEDEIERILKTYKLPYKKSDNPAKEAAKFLAEGKIVGWFQGKWEFGPRALGNRSILADPRDPSMKDKVNKAVKFREEWRPFAPSVLEEYAEDYFDTCSSSPFMILTFWVKPEKRAVIPAVTHIDGTARVHTVNKNVNPLYWQLIEEFRRLTGVPVVLNTSFNLKGEPIVGSPFDAIRTFYTSGLDVLIMGPFVLEK